MNKRSWQIVYSNYSGLMKKSVDLIYKELGSYVLRDKGVYTIHVLPCICELDANITENAVIIGKYDDSKIIQKYINRDEIKENGYVVKVFDNPNNSEFKLAIITANSDVNVFYGAVDFVDDYFANSSPWDGCMRLVESTFSGQYWMPNYYKSNAPKINRRCVFTWGHPINDYKEYIDNFARLKLNQLIIWNDYMPINAKEVIDYAHEYGIEVIWGYAWGWSTSCKDFDINTIKEIQRQAIEKFEREYAPYGVDGIYFQSFTENTGEYLGGKLVSEVVTDFVNDTANILLEKYPNLYIIFGLHAKSVKDHLEFIKNVDSRVEIMWEDLGCFPYDYYPCVPDDILLNDAYNQTKNVITLRENGKVSLLFRGFATLAWRIFEYQSGPYVLGRSSERMAKEDKALIKNSWKYLQAEWISGAGKVVNDLINYIHSLGNNNVALGMAGQFAGGIYLPYALCAELLYNNDDGFDAILRKVSKRRCVEFV